MHILAIEEYGLRCLIQVAQRGPDQTITTPEIARAEGIGPEYAAKILRTLREGGLVTSTRGAAGGYRLARPASEITVRQAIAVLGGEIFPAGFCDCHPGQRRDCVHATNCSVRAMWRNIKRMLSRALDAITLEDLCRDESALGTVIANPANAPRKPLAS